MFYIIVNENHKWHPLESCGKKILFLSKEEGDRYLDGWKRMNKKDCIGYTVALVE